jgi:hypothetical protein
MRRILFLLAATVAFTLSTQAQTIAQTETAIKRTNDHLFIAVRVDMTPTEVAGIAARLNWTLLEESGETVRYETERENSRFSGIYTIHFSHGKARAVSGIMTGTIEEKELVWMFDIMRSVLVKRAESVKVDNARTTMTQTTTDRRTMRLIWDQSSPTQVAVTAKVDYLEEGALPLK